jgi:hypothetical protein
MIELTRGDREELDLQDLKDADGVPTEFAADDIVLFTMKRDYAETDEEAIVQKSNVIGGIIVDADTNLATVVIYPEDWDDLEPLEQALRVVADVQLVVNGDPTNVVTLWNDTLLVKPDVTLTVPTGV